MGDLISRKATTDFIKRCTQGYHPQGYRTAVMDILDLIEQQDTVFDLESVIAKVKEKLDGAKLLLEMQYDFEEQDSIAVKNNILFFRERKERYEEFFEILNSAANATNGKIGG